MPSVQADMSSQTVCNWVPVQHCLPPHLPSPKKCISSTSSSVSHSLTVPTGRIVCTYPGQSQFLFPQIQPPKTKVHPSGKHSCDACFLAPLGGGGGGLFAVIVCSLRILRTRGYHEILGRTLENEGICTYLGANKGARGRRS